MLKILFVLFCVLVSQPSFATYSKTLTVPGGGTGLATLTSGGVAVGAGTSVPTFVTCSTSGFALTWNGSAWACASVSGGGSQTSQVQVEGFLGLGSTNTRVIRFNTADKNVGSDITYAASSTLGDSFTVNSAGMYCGSYTVEATSSSVQMGITVNGTALSTDPATPLTYAQGARALGWQNTGGFGDQLSWCGILATNDVIRFHSNNSTLRNDIRTSAVVTKVSN